MQRSIDTTIFLVLFITVTTLLTVSSSAAQNDVGTIEMELAFGILAGREMQIREPEMCDGRASTVIDYNKNENTVIITTEFDGLPYRPSICYDYDPSTPFNQYPDCVEDGKWQLWFSGHVFTKQATFYYDAETHMLIGCEFDDVSFPGDAIARELPVGQAICSPMFESDPITLEANVTFEFDYDTILDMRGTAGMYVAFTPLRLDDPETAIIYYTAGLPQSEAMNFDDLLGEIQSDGMLMIATSLEPDPKPEYLASRDNIMIGWTAAFPESPLTDMLGLPMDLTSYGACGSFQLPDPWAFLSDSPIATAVTVDDKLTTTWGNIKASQ